jgi:hypothetical protein
MCTRQTRELIVDLRIWIPMMRRVHEQMQTKSRTPERLATLLLVIPVGKDIKRTAQMTAGLARTMNGSIRSRQRDFDVYSPHIEISLAAPY